MKSLMVVADKKNEQYATYLQGLVSQNDDTDEVIIGTKDGEVSVVLYNEKQYLDNKPKIPSNQRIIFFGNSKLAVEERRRFTPIYNEFGMVFSQLGKRGALYVDHVVPMKDYNNFIQMAKDIQDDVKKVALRADDVAQVAAGAVVGAGAEFAAGAVGLTLFMTTGLFLPVIAIGGAAALAGGGVGAIKYNAKKKEIMHQQFDCLVLKCYRDYLNDFMK